MKKIKNIDDKTLTQLEDDDWGSPSASTYPPPESYLTQTCYQLRHKLLRDFSVEDLRIMIGQGIGLPYLLPKAIKVLRDDPFAEGRHYIGDLLCQVLRVDAAFYSANLSMKKEVGEIVDIAWSVLHVLDEDDARFAKREIERALVVFDRQA